MWGTLDKLLARVASALWPPPIGASDEDHYAWRVGITVMFMLLASVVVVHLAIIKGMMPFVDAGYLEAEFEDQYNADQRRMAAKEAIRYSLEVCRREGTEEEGSYAEMLQMSLETYFENGGTVEHLKLPRCIQNRLRDLPEQQ